MSFETMWKYLSFLLLCALGVYEVSCLRCLHCMERSSDFTCQHANPWDDCPRTSSHCFAKMLPRKSSWLVKGCTEYRFCPEIEESGGFCCSGDWCNVASEIQIESELLPGVGETSGSGEEDLRFQESENVSASSPEPWVLLDAENQSRIAVTKYGESDIEESYTLGSSESVLKDLLLSPEPSTLQEETIGEGIGTNPIYNETAVSDLEQTRNDFSATVEQTLWSADGEAKLLLDEIVEQAENVSVPQMFEIEKMQIDFKSGDEQELSNEETFERMNFEVGVMSGALHEIGNLERGVNATASYDLGDVQVNIPASESSLLQHTSTAHEDEYTPTLTQEPPTRPPSTQEPPTRPPSAQEPPTRPPSAQEPPARPPSTQEPAARPPSTQEPPTRPPSTQEPPTRPPSTQEPPARPPSTQEPPARPPSTQEPPARPPSTQEPPARPPSTQEPPARPPSTQEPPARPPSTQEPAARPPSTQEPAARPPSTQEPAARPPSTQEPAARPPSTQEPAARPPSTQEPAARPPSTQEPAARPPSTQEPTARPPSTQEPLTRGVQVTGLP
uniref:uncharacterized protein n=1 Tax=Myxine glutinosa TaxID=7769 RepID=UPI00358F2380